MIAREPHGFMRGEHRFGGAADIAGGTPEHGQLVYVRAKGYDNWWRAVWDANRHVAVTGDDPEGPHSTHERHLSAWLPRND